MGIPSKSSGSSRQRSYAYPPPAKGISRCWAWIPDSWACRLFLLITLAEASINIAIESMLFVRYQFHRKTHPTPDDESKSRALPVFVIVFSIAHIYQFLLAVDAVINRNTILVIGSIIFNACFLVYSLIQISEMRTVLGDGVAQGSSQTVPVQVLTGAIPIVIALAEISFVVLGWKLWKEFGWQIYKKIGADRSLKRGYLHYQVYVALLKFDFFIFIAYCIQLVLVVKQIGTAERWITIISAPFSLLILFFAWYSVRKELKYGMLAFLVGLTGAMVYFVYKLFRIWQLKDTLYKEVYKSLTVFSTLSMLLLLITAAMTIQCMINFDRGLKHAIARTRKDHAAAGAGADSGYLVGYDGKTLTHLGDGSTSVLHLQPRLSLD
ncbi:uncharacterized protein PAN0_001d0512 [Moesziomyces antarcticus]|uniref:Uncharacterized protein n=1 Tax=Pseudozyma antarctica TaxID=84753 RepID=A0A5C3FEK1_PSEA2|nr:uncharacterized protein PAN0_001d0512 [Moesziomyces antarcticus]GAK62312.1 conserved hypothetical protein [Moesziomyces antarcticus]SPO42854.1 uncharacterized protein PSANT_00538 [Moesziomyces antarcticus]